MAEYPKFSIGDLVNFSGRSEDDYPEEYSATAIKQAILLFKIATCRKGSRWPTEEEDQEMATNAILAMAESLILGQPYAETHASPFNSETIGSYSYSKKTTAQVKAGEPTGIMWFDLAVLDLSLCGLNGTTMETGGIEMFEYDGVFTEGVQYPQWVGPAHNLRGGYPR